MKRIQLLTLILLSGLTTISCSKEEELEENITISGENNTSEKFGDLEVEQFIYDAMSDIYLYKADVPELANHYFSNNDEKNEFLAGFDSPEALFDGVTASQDRFSFMTDDYVALEESFNGISSSVAGMDFGLGRISGTNNLFGFLQYIVPGTPAEEAGLTRGTVFTEVNGTKLTEQNYNDLLEAQTFTINTGKIVDGYLEMSDTTVTLSHSTYTENPVLISKTLELDGQKVGYLMYNSFVGDFDDELNEAFGKLKADGVTDLILDLRYNGGGSVESAVDLASMITGQFEGKVFMKEQWNEKYQKAFEAENPETLLNRFDPQIRTNEAINSLGLSRVYVITSRSTASASELVINGLEPYINVIQVGWTTTGKFQASATLYDSPDYGKEGANENHTYALQPLIFKSANAAGKSDYIDGLKPDLQVEEDVANMGVLGDPSEPLLNATINYLQGKAQQIKRPELDFEIVAESGMNDPTYQRMYIEELPALIKRDNSIRK